MARGRRAVQSSLLLACLLAAACSRTTTTVVDSAPASASGSSSTGGQPAGKDPEVVLRQTTTQLHTAVDSLRAGLTVKSANQLRDARQVCQLGSADEWPAQWVYDQRVYLAGPDARPAGRTVVQRYGGQGWKVTTLPPADGTDQYTLERNGFVISIAAADDGSVDIHTNGPCVNADGTLTSR